MKRLYIDCQMGVAGDMMLAALLDLAGGQATLMDRLQNIGIPGLDAKLEPCVREGLTGSQLHISTGEDPVDGRTLADVHHIIDGLAVSEQVKTDAKGVYRIIAEAEAKVHETDLDHVHFHEVGALNAIADITGVCMVMENLAVDYVTASPIHVGSGTVKCAHGILPVPAPATAAIVADLPTYSGDVFGELCTPTGAALVKYFADEFGSCPDMTVAKSGRGFGSKVFPGKVNGLHVVLGE